MTNRINKEESGPIPRDETTGGKDQVAHRNVVQVLVHSLGVPDLGSFNLGQSTKSNGVEYD